MPSEAGAGNRGSLGPDEALKKLPYWYFTASSWTKVAWGSARPSLSYYTTEAVKAARYSDRRLERTG